MWCVPRLYLPKTLTAEHSSFSVKTKKIYHIKFTKINIPIIDLDFSNIWSHFSLFQSFFQLSVEYLNILIYSNFWWIADKWLEFLQKQIVDSQLHTVFLWSEKSSTWKEADVSYRNHKPSMYTILIFNNYVKLKKLTKSISVLLIFFECKIHDLNTQHGKKFYLISPVSGHRETFQIIMWQKNFHYLKSSFLFFLFFVSGYFFLTTVGHLADTSALCFSWTGIFCVPGKVLKNTTED